MNGVCSREKAQSDQGAGNACIRLKKCSSSSRTMNNNAPHFPGSFEAKTHDERVQIWADIFEQITGEQRKGILAILAEKLKPWVYGIAARIGTKHGVSINTLAEIGNNTVARFLPGYDPLFHGDSVEKHLRTFVQNAMHLSLLTLPRKASVEAAVPSPAQDPQRRPLLHLPLISEVERVANDPPVPGVATPAHSNGHLSIAAVGNDALTVAAPMNGTSHPVGAASTNGIPISPNGTGKNGAPHEANGSTHLKKSRRQVQVIPLAPKFEGLPKPVRASPVKVEQLWEPRTQDTFQSEAVIAAEALFDRQREWARNNGVVTNFSSPRELHHHLIRWKLRDWVYDRTDELAEENKLDNEGHAALRTVAHDTLVICIPKFDPDPEVHGNDLDAYLQTPLENALMRKTKQLQNHVLT